MKKETGLIIVNCICLILACVGWAWLTFAMPTIKPHFDETRKELESSNDIERLRELGKNYVDIYEAEYNVMESGIKVAKYLLIFLFFIFSGNIVITLSEKVSFLKKLNK